MLDLNFIRSHPDIVKKAIEKKHCQVNLDEFLKLDEKRRALLQEVEGLRRRQNEESKVLPTLSPSDREQKLADLKTLSADLSKLEDELRKVEVDFEAIFLQIPNIPDKDVPEGETEADNIEIKKWGKPPKFSFPLKSTEVLMEKLNLLDEKQGAEVSGAKFYYLKNEGVMVEMALLRMAIDFLKEKSFQLVSPPDLFKKEAFYGAGHFPPEEDAYYIEKDKLYLAGTAEVGLAALYAGKTVEEKDLPIRLAGISACFRREAGTYGKESAGLYRVHQFNKVEMFSLTKPEESKKEHEFLLGLAEEILQKLGLHYRLVNICGGELGMPQVKKYDLETWMPSRKKYGETHSASNDTDFQARRLSIKYRKKDGQTAFVHTLNNTAIATPRIFIPLFETYQTEEGGVKLPEVLAKYTGFSEIK